MKKINVKKVEFNVEVLRPLLHSLPRSGGETFVGPFNEEDGGAAYALCLSCGAKGKQIMLKKHKPGCEHIAHWDAVEALRRLLGA